MHKAKNEKKLARGFFAPSNYPGGFRGQDKGKGKVKGKFKGKGKQGGRRDERRAKGNMVKVGIAALKDRARCWTCGQLGHLSAQCPRASESVRPGRACGAPSTSSAFGSSLKGTYFVSKFVDGEDFMNYINFTFLTTAGHVGLLDTGEINGLCGMKQFLQYGSQILKPSGFGFLHVEGPREVGSVGGRDAVLTSVQMPMAWEAFPASCRWPYANGPCRFCCPSACCPSAMKGRIYLDEGEVKWAAHDDAASDIITGHRTRRGGHQRGRRELHEPHPRRGDVPARRQARRVPRHARHSACSSPGPTGQLPGRIEPIAHIPREAVQVRSPLRHATIVIITASAKPLSPRARTTPIQPLRHHPARHPMPRTLPP